MRDIIVIGASAGGVPVLLRLAETLPPNVPAAILIVLHVGANASILPALLAARGSNPARHAVDGESVVAGRLYVAPPDRHLLVEGGRIFLSAGAKEHHTRPAIDPLFRSAALHYGSRVIGVILTGRYDDGTAGLQAINSCGGLAVVQDPEEATEPSMPASAIANVEIDRKVSVAEIAETLIELTRQPFMSDAEARNTSTVQNEHDVSLNRGEPMRKLDSIGAPSHFGCPDCDGVLWQLRDSKPLRFRCHTGHAYTLRSLAHTQAIKAEDILWAAMRAMQEQTNLLTRIATGYDEDGDIELTKRYQLEASEQQSRVNALFRLITNPHVAHGGYNNP